VAAVHSLVQHQAIVDYLASVVCIAPIMTLMGRAPTCIGIASETLKSLFEKQNPEKGTLPRLRNVQSVQNGALTARPERFQGGGAACATGNLVRQAIDAKLIPVALELLDKQLDVSNQAAMKAQLVNALKGACGREHPGSSSLCTFAHSSARNA